MSTRGNKDAVMRSALKTFGAAFSLPVCAKFSSASSRERTHGSVLCGPRCTGVPTCMSISSQSEAAMRAIQSLDDEDGGKSLR